MSVKLHYQIDPGSGVPAYRQMMDQVKYYVASGALKAGEQLDSIRELAQKLAVNPTTVVKAYNELAHEGVIELRRGRGAFVSEKAAVMNQDEKAKALRRLARQLAVEAAQMGADEGFVMRIIREELKDVVAEDSAQQVGIKVLKG